MTFVNTIMSVIFIAASSYISYQALKKYVSHNKNYEFILYWGLSFALVALVYLGIFFEPKLSSEAVRQGLSNTVHILATFAWFLQLYAVAYVSKFCVNYDTPNCKHCKMCKRKTIRITLQSAMIITITVAQLIYAIAPLDLSIASGMRAIGIPILDAYYEMIHGIVAMIIVTMLLQYRKFKIHLYLGFLLVGISEFMQVANILIFKYDIDALMQVEWGVATGGMLIMFIEVMKLINHNELQE